MQTLTHSRTVTLAGAKVEFVESGDGPPLLFLHGAEGVRRTAFLERLAARFRVVAPSHPGFGRSELPDWLDRPHDVAHLYLELIDALELQQFDLLGVSVGGWIAAELATMAPRRVRRMALVGPVGVKTGARDRLDVPDIFAMAPDRLNELLYHDPAAAFDPAAASDEDLGIWVRNRETLALLTWDPYMHDPKLRHRLHRVRCPVLMLRGASDDLISQDYLERYAALFPSATVAVVPEAGHSPEAEQPDAFASKIIEFLSAGDVRAAQAGGARP